jgi:Lrp/AsnC family transcriptional regulator, leucine-responsive regulatory protein
VNRSSDQSVKKEPLDDVDVRILTLLLSDGRMSYSDLAARVHLSTPGVIKRIRRMEDSGIIRGYHAEVDLGKIGLPVSTFIRLTATRANEKRFLEQLPSFPEISECHLMAGDISFVIRASVSSIAHLHELLTRVGQFGETDSAVILESPREQSAAGIERGK